MKLTYAVLDLQWKSVGLNLALQDNGHVSLDHPRANVFLVDFDGNIDAARERRWFIGECVDHGGMVLVYPHGARPTYQYDGIVEPDPRVTAYLVQGPAAVETYRLIGLEKPVYAVGWYYCPLVPFETVKKVERILFCPSHPFGLGKLDAKSCADNAAAYKACLAYGADLHMTKFGPLEHNGLWFDERVTYKESDLVLRWQDIDAADLVIAEGTKAYLAIARGKPTIMIGQDRAPADDHDRYQVPRWNEYGAQSRYPIDLADGDFKTLVDLACCGSDAVDEWKAGFIGNQMEPRVFSELVIGLYETHRRLKGALQVGASA